MTDIVRVIIHATGSPFVETYITICDLHRQAFHPETDDEIFVRIAKSVVGKGLPFWEVTAEEIDAVYDPETRNAWVIDPDALGKPDGYGESSNV